jgi:luciferase-type oxidoreductase
MSGIGSCRRSRDVPLRDPSFGDIGQVYDPWVYLGWIAAQTRTIALATGSIILPLRHPLYTAKASASIDQLSGGRFVLGVASGDRPVEFPAFGVDIDKRAALFAKTLGSSARCSPRSFRGSDRRMAHCVGLRIWFPSRSAACHSWLPGTAGKAWNESLNMPTAGSPTHDPSNDRRN